MTGEKVKAAGAYARELLKAHPSATTRSLAKLAHRAEPKLFPSVESARTTLRHHRGARGAKSKRSHPIAERTREQINHAGRWGGMLPEPSPNKWRWRELPPEPKRWLILSDIHIPYHDASALGIALDYGDKEKCDGVLLLGDILDCYKLSKWQQDPRERDFVAEVENGRKFIEALKSRWKTIVWKCGNHEARYERYIMSRAPELIGLPVAAFDATLGLPENGVGWIPAMDPIRVGKLTILHGHEWGVRFSSPVNPARGTFLRSRECVLAGHEHRTSEHTEPSLIGTIITCWSVGCLCDLRPQYRPLNSWNHGFATLDLTEGGTWRVQNKRIIEGHVV